MSGLTYVACCCFNFNNWKKSQVPACCRLVFWSVEMHQAFSPQLSFKSSFLCNPCQSLFCCCCQTKEKTCSTVQKFKLYLWVGNLCAQTVQLPIKRFHCVCTINHADHISQHVLQLLCRQVNITVIILTTCWQWGQVLFVHFHRQQGQKPRDSTFLSSRVTWKPTYSLVS